ncbi:hypothetical protein FACS1894130_01170 [Spirochaetia bacterium]|nr:hypothetical protein FACS1894130_01170 [Spirochaetia bacterium]
MTKRIYLKRGLCACIAGAFLLAMGCTQPEDDVGRQTEQNGSKKTGKVVISINSDIENFSQCVFDFVRDDGEAATPKIMEGAASLTVNLKPGTWNIRAAGFIAGTDDAPPYVAAQGTANVIVKEHEKVNAVIQLDESELPQDYEFSNVEALKNYLAGLPINIAAVPYPVKINGVDLSSKETVGNNMRTLYSALNDRFVTLDLSGCTGTHLVSASALPTLANRKKIVSMILPDSITEIDSSGFSGYSAMVSVSIPKVTTLEYSAFKDCDNLQLVYGPEVITIGTATAAANGAFSGCDALNFVYLPKAKTIGSYAFYDCDALESVELPSAETVNNFVFKGCDKLKIVTLPLVTSIGNEAFYNDTALCRVILGSTPPSLGTKPFSTNMPIEGIYVPAGAVGTYQNADNWSSFKSKVKAIE